jgi:hypothetical protein
MLFLLLTISVSEELILRFRFFSVGKMDSESHGVPYMEAAEGVALAGFGVGASPQRIPAWLG